jgi:hypothetical protein
MRLSGMPLHLLLAMPLVLVMAGTKYKLVNTYILFFIYFLFLFDNI